jgi:hypothetical protein
MRRAVMGGRRRFDLGVENLSKCPRYHRPGLQQVPRKSLFLHASHLTNNMVDRDGCASVVYCAGFKAVTIRLAP